MLIHYAPYLLLRPPGILLFHWLIDNSRIPKLLTGLVKQLMRALPTLANHKLSVPILIKLLDQMGDPEARHLLVHEGLFGDANRLSGILYGTVEQRCDNADVVLAQTSGKASISVAGSSAHMNQLLHPDVDASNDASLFAMSTFHRASGGPPSDLGATIVCKGLDIVPLPMREQYIKRVLETARPMDRDYFGKLTQMCPSF